ncbi:hypothetical protein [Microbaculum marinisediminis]|uniref:HTH cro/C1-type domain-containing protein n=1 Tax=Microbaculum marinisediminis TaxID=2931392 RepID=A0AAW5QT11_9HYPH|nr:hypothetical protein [Microbaculum sp. A6E488]MCT8970614.1 hypothetical protein [Microbaculum sp. A6E488]
MSTRPGAGAINWERLGRVASARLDPRAGIVSRSGIRALRARRGLSAGDYLSVCAALDLDPLDLDPVGLAPAGKDVPAYRGRLSHEIVAAAVLGRRLALGITSMEAAARAIGGLSAATLCRIGQGRALSAGALLRIAAWTGKHPNEFTVSDSAPPALIAEIVESLARINPPAMGPEAGPGKACENNPFHDVSHVKRALARLAREARAREGS